MKTLVIGDIHGSLDALKDILRRAGVTQETKRDYHVIQVGDLLNLAESKTFRGFESFDYETLKYVLDTGFIDRVVVGNHEAYHLLGWQDCSWNGMARKLNDDMAKLLGESRDKHELWGNATVAHNYVITHAGIHELYAGRFIYCETAVDVLSRLLRWENQDMYHDWENGTLWTRGRLADNILDGQIVGHTPHATNPRKIGNTWYIDSGGYMYGKGSGIIWENDNDGWQVVPQ